MCTRIAAIWVILSVLLAISWSQRADNYEYPKYKFTFTIPDEGLHTREEESISEGHVSGKYSYVDPNGELRVIRYNSTPETGYKVYGHTDMPVNHPIQPSAAPSENYGQATSIQSVDSRLTSPPHVQTGNTGLTPWVQTANTGLNPLVQTANTGLSPRLQTANNVASKVPQSVNNVEEIKNSNSLFGIPSFSKIEGHDLDVTRKFIATGLKPSSSNFLYRNPSQEFPSPSFGSGQDRSESAVYINQTAQRQKENSLLSFIGEENNTINGSGDNVPKKEIMSENEVQKFLSSKRSDLLNYPYYPIRMPLNFFPYFVYPAPHLMAIHPGHFAL